MTTEPRGPQDRSLPDFLFNNSSLVTLHPSLEFVPILFNDRIRQQLLAHGLHVGLSLGPILLAQVQFHILPDPHVARRLEAQGLQRMLDRLPLRIENAWLQRDMNLRFHGLLSCSNALVSALMDRRIQRIPTTVASPPNESATNAHRHVESVR